MILLATSTLQSCARVDVKRVDVKKMTYKALRQHDCRVNELNSFCERGFAHEFSEYERIRQNFLNNDQTTHYRANLHQTANTTRVVEQ